MNSSSSSSCGAIDCCECALPIGLEGPMRGALLLPCQHVMHLSCAEFNRRRANAFIQLQAQEEFRTHFSGLTTERELSFGVCPRCHCAIEATIPLYLESSELTQTSSNTAEVMERFQATHQAQKKSLQRLRSLHQHSTHVMELGHHCATLHGQRAALLSEMKHYNELFPAPAKEGPAVGGGGAELPTESMSKTELECYAAQTAPALARAQTELFRQRQVGERRRKQLQTLRRRYNKQRELAQLSAKIDKMSHPAREGRRDHKHKHQQKQRQSAEEGRATAEDKDSQGNSPSQTPQRPRRRHTAIDVDSVPLPPRLAAAAGSPLSPPVEDVEMISDSPEQQSVIDVDDMSDTGSVAVNEELPVEEQEVFLLPNRFPSGQAKLQTISAKHIRLLPRREDRLWQPTL